MSSDFWNVFLIKYIKSRVEIGKTYYQILGELEHWVKNSMELVASDDMIDGVISDIESGKVKLVYDDVLKKQKASEVKKYISFVQEVSDGRGGMFVTCHAFGPFSESIATWKMSLLGRRLESTSKNFLSAPGNMSILCDKSKSAYMLKDVGKKGSPNISFVMMDSSKCPTCNVISKEGIFELVSGSELKSWHDFALPEIRKMWKLYLLSDILKDFKA